MTYLFSLHHVSIWKAGQKDGFKRLFKYPDKFNLGPELKMMNPDNLITVTTCKPRVTLPSITQNKLQLPVPNIMSSPVNSY